MIPVLRQRIRAQLDLDDRAPRSQPAFDVPDGIRPVVGIDASPLPTGIRIVDAAIHAARKEPDGIRHTQDEPASVGPQREQ